MQAQVLIGSMLDLFLSTFVSIRGALFPWRTLPTPKFSWYIPLPMNEPDWTSRFSRWGEHFWINIRARIVCDTAWHGGYTSWQDGKNVLSFGPRIVRLKDEMD